MSAWRKEECFFNNINNMTSSVDFEPILAELEADKELGEKLREQVKELERTYRVAAKALNKSHSTPSSQIQNLVQQVASSFGETRQAIRYLIELVPQNQYYKWNDTWSMTIQRIVFAIAYTYYLGTGRLITKEQVADVLAVPQSENHRFKLATEEYLHALVSLVNELSRLAVNSVTLGDFGTPVRLSAFVKDLHTGFQMLNLKNDSLRKRFDSIKYDVKKIEEVVYDISLRGLAGSGPPSGVGTEVDDVEAERVLGLLRN